MEKTIDELLQAPYWIVDILPEQVPADGPGQYFAVERYFLRKDRLAAVKEKHIPAADPGRRNEPAAGAPC